jgi:hypothetical protein
MGPPNMPTFPPKKCAILISLFSFAQIMRDVYLSQVEKWSDELPGQVDDVKSGEGDGGARSSRSSASAHGDA